jgi:hypothetical protein
MKFDITPDSHLIESIRNSGIYYPEALSEMVDNSFDAGATAVSIVYDNASKIMSVQDNGKGCHDFLAMLRIGQHLKTETTRLGRYGVGLKNSAIGLADLLTIESHAKKVTVDWMEIARSGWEFEASVEPSALTVGTRLTLGQLVKTARLSSVMESLAFNFAPALWSGRSITINDSAVCAWQVPELQDAVEVESVSPEGFGFRLRAGMVRDNPHDAFILAYEHRILGGTCEPLGEYVTGGRFLGFVELFGPWPLLKHKDGLADGSAAQWLYRELAAECEDLFKACEAARQTLEVKELEAEIAEALADLGPKNKRRYFGRNTDNKGVKPTGEGAKHRSGGGGISIDFKDIEDGLIGRVETNSTRVSVTLNTLHPYVQASRRESSKLAIPAIALSLVVADQVKKDEMQRKLTFEAQEESKMFLEGLTKTLKTLGERRAA